MYYKLHKSHTYCIFTEFGFLNNITKSIIDLILYPVCHHLDASKVLKVENIFFWYRCLLNRNELTKSPLNNIYKLPIYCLLFNHAVFSFAWFTGPISKPYYRHKWAISFVFFYYSPSKLIGFTYSLLLLRPLQTIADPDINLGNIYYA